jgi:hypothetical protein
MSLVKLTDPGIRPAAGAFLSGRHSRPEIVIHLTSKSA